MDPNAALANAREALDDWLDADPETSENDRAAARLAAAFSALDGWVSKGGYLPKDWVRPGSAEWDARKPLTTG